MIGTRIIRCRYYGPPMNPAWCEAQIRALHLTHTREDKSRKLHLSSHVILQQERAMGLPPVTWAERMAPTFDAWYAAASAEAREAGIETSLVMSDTRRPFVAKARWRAWKRLVDAGGYSLAGIGRTTGFDHTSLINGLRRLNGEPAKANRARQAAMGGR